MHTSFNYPLLTMKLLCIHPTNRVFFEQPTSYMFAVKKKSC